VSLRIHDDVYDDDLCKYEGLGRGGCHIGAKFDLRTQTTTDEKMTAFRAIRELLLVAYAGDVLSDEEFVLLYELYISKNPDFKYWEYNMFDLQTMNDDECNAEFRFLKQDIYTLADVLQLPNTITTYNGLVVQSIPALCMLLKRFAYPCRYMEI